ncbi:hypothetical protein Tco_1041507 [Tanacetum coccineum]|uniref:Uncharacterized protein n=1 Tax=Tanacetum coccineum TaxID=301880 RepID=A0ABQ5GIS9_9ASTR
MRVLLSLVPRGDPYFIGNHVCMVDKMYVYLMDPHVEMMIQQNLWMVKQMDLQTSSTSYSPFDLEAFSDSDYAGASLDRKSTTGGCQILRQMLISWQCKRQTIVANSTTEAEYVAAANYHGHVLWIQNQMLDYGFNFMNTEIYIDNESTICVVKNPVFHSKTKHIEIRCYLESWKVFKIGFDGCIGLKMLFGPILRVKHGKKLVSVARLALCCWEKVSTVRHRVSAARKT